MKPGDYVFTFFNEQIVSAEILEIKIRQGLGYTVTNYWLEFEDNDGLHKFSTSVIFTAESLKEYVNTIIERAK